MTSNELIEEHLHTASTQTANVGLEQSSQAHSLIAIGYALLGIKEVLELNLDALTDATETGATAIQQIARNQEITSDRLDDRLESIAQKIRNLKGGGF